MNRIKKLNNRWKRGISLLLVFIYFGVIATCIYLFVSIANGRVEFTYRQFVQVGIFWFFLIATYLLVWFGKRDYIENWTAPSYLVEPLTATITLAVWFGSISGFAQLALMIYQKYHRQYPVYAGPDAVWYRTLGEMLLLVTAGLLLYAAANRWTLVGKYSSIVFLYSFLAALSFLLSNLGIAEYSAIILALGLASLSARMLKQDSSEFQFLVYHALGWLWPMKERRSRSRVQNRSHPVEEQVLTRREFLASSGALVGGVILTSFGVDRLLQRIDEQPPAHIPDLLGRPNILLVIMDTVSAQHTSLHGYSRSTTPFLDQLARECVVFENAISPSSWTLPAHASLFTGHFPNQLSANWLTPLDQKYPTLAETLRDQGYATAAFVGNLKYCSREFGLSRGFTHYEDYQTDLEQVLLGSNITRWIREDLDFRERTGIYRPLGYKDAGHVTHDFQQWLATHSPAQPFFAFINYYDAHSPYVPPLNYAKKFTSKRPNGILNEDNLDIRSYSPARIQELRDAYDGSIAYVDANIKALISQLRENKLLDQTLVIILSDHGEHFGEHQLLSHGNSLYTQLLHVLCLMRLPGGVSAGAKVKPWISMQDLSATILDIARINSQNTLPGQSLRSFFPGTAGGWNYAPVNSYVDLWKDGWMKSTIVEGMHLILAEDGKQELYDLNNDALDKENLVDSSAGRKIARELQAVMERNFPAQ